MMFTDSSHPLMLLVPFVAGFVVALCATPVVIVVAHRLGFTDEPDGRRKRHVGSPALGGGVVIYLSTLLVAGAFYAVLNAREGYEGFLSEVGVLIVAATLILALGLIDDWIGIHGVHKLAGQLIAAMVLILGGFTFSRFEVLGITFELGHLGYLVTLLWILGVINAMNLMDGADGVASILGFGVCGSLGIIAVCMGHFEHAIVPLTMSGALLAFLVFNFPPARIYLGDSGSMLIGLIAAAVAIWAPMKSQATFAIAVPVSLLAIPILDTGFAVFRRKLTGRSIYDTDRGHLHHRLLEMGATPVQLVMLVGIVTLTTSIAAVSSLWIGMDVIAPITVLIVLIGLAICRVFGHGELKLVWTRLKWHNARVVSGDTNARTTTIHIQGTHAWEAQWQRMVRFAEHQDLAGMRWTLNMPWVHEAYHGRWGDMRCFSQVRCWRISVPLQLGDQVAGWIEIAGKRRGDMPSVFPRFQELADATLDYLARVESAEELKSPIIDPVPYPNVCSTAEPVAKSLTEV